jgi:hypothetical protein
MNQFVLLVAIVVVFASVKAQDPAGGWMAYAVGEVPAGTERITSIEMTWTVGAEPKHSRAFFSPWFGMDPADNLNLIQPVNPWSGSSWGMYTEYYQWKPTHNSNSKQYTVKAGQTLKGTMVYDKNTDSYDLSQTIVETGVTSSQNVVCQDGKKYNLPYVVYEKTFPCADYPPDEIVTFRDIKIECDGSDCTDTVKWRSEVEDANCKMEAVVHNNSAISITWDTSARSRFDDMPRADLVKLNAKGWAKDFMLSEDGNSIVRKSPEGSMMLDSALDNKFTCSMCKEMLKSGTITSHECKSECSGWWDWTQSSCEYMCGKLCQYSPTTACWEAGYCPKI